MKITQTRVALAVLVAALIVAAVWRMAPPAAGTAATAEASMRGAPPVPDATGPPLARPLARDRDDSPATIAAPSVGRAFWYADDYYTFIRDHAAAAYGGDGRAAYYIAGPRSSVGRGRNYMRRDGTAFGPYQEPCARFATRIHSRSCRRCEGAYTWRYWQERAISAGDPLALLQLAVEEQQSPQQQRAAVDAAARSGDPEVYYTLGLWLPMLGVGLTEAVGWQLVACELGYDCRMDNPRVGMGCLEAGYCTSGQTVAEKLRDEVGFDPLARAQARADAIVAELKAGRVPRVELARPLSDPTETAGRRLD